MIGRVWEALWHRWYITVPSLVLAAVLAGLAWWVVPPTYERTASQLLVPGAGTVPPRGNPYFYLSGLAQAADVIVRAVGSENVVHEIDQSFSDVEIEVTRDPSTAGPVILVRVEAPSDADAAAVLDLLVTRTKVVLEDLQASDHVAPSDRILVQTITIDQQGSLRQRNRIVATGAVGAIIAILGLLMAALVDGLSARRRRRLDDPDSATIPGDVPEAERDPMSPAEPLAEAGHGGQPEAGVTRRPESNRRKRRARAGHAGPPSGVSDGDGLVDTPVGAGRA